MSIERLINTINKELLEFEDVGTPIPASSDEVARLKQDISTKFNYSLPPIFEELLSYSNGVLFNGLTIWPTDKYWLFHESFVDANTNLRDSFGNQSIYFGTRDEELYIYDLNSKLYQAIEYVGTAEWANFTDAKEMFEFMLARSLD